jgi:hypothetical protein
MKDCWIDTKGKIYEVCDCGHNDFASKMIEEEMGKWESYEFLHKHNKSAYQWLHDKGWVRVKYNTAYLPKVEILGGCIDLTKQQRNTVDPAMNSRQLRVAKLICEEVGEDFHRAINDKRFW